MNNNLTIPARKLKLSQSELTLACIVLILGTALRVSLLLIYPFLVLIVCMKFRLVLSKQQVALFALLIISFLLSFFNGWFLKYKLLSLFYMVPFILLLFSEPAKLIRSDTDLVRSFFKSLSFVAVLNDVVGIIQVFLNPSSDDSFTGIYSTFSISLNGLAVLNMILFVYYFCLFLNNRTPRHLLFAIFFLLCSVMGFYGAGLAVLILAFIFTFFRPSLKAILKFVFITAISLFLAIYLLALLKPNVLDYNKANLKKLSNFNVETGPRKLISFYNYGIAYTTDLKDFLFGSGPGTFNSRSAFTVGSPYYFSSAGILKSENKPYYFGNYAYTLWNNTNTSQALFQDGFRNQPFSSVLSFLGEYGLLFTLAFAWCYLVYYKRVRASLYGNRDNLATPYFRVFRFLFLLLPLLLLIDNFLEYPEITFLVVLSMKLLHIELSKRQFQNQ